MAERQTINASDFPPGLIGTPCTDWMWTDAAIAHQRLALSPGSERIWNRGASTIAGKRNHLVKRVLEDDDARWLLMIDSDQVPPPVTPLQLLSVGEDIVSGLIFSRVPPHLPCCGFVDDDGNYSHLKEIRPRAEPIREVDWAGTGCMLIRRHVLEALEEPWFEHTEPGSGEDTYFCRKAREAGFSIHVDTRLDVGHVGATSVDADYVSTWYRTEAGQSVGDGYSQKRGWRMSENRPG